MSQFNISRSNIKPSFTRLFLLILIYFLLPNCAWGMLEEEEHIDLTSSLRGSNTATTSMERISLDSMIEDEEFNIHLTNLSNNQLVKLVNEHLDLISGKQVTKTYGKRKAAILSTLFAGAIVSSIGSLTFLIGEHFPEEFSKFANFSISDNVSSGVGKYLGWSNMAVEALFYIWTIHGILPPLKPKQTNEQQQLETENAGFLNRYCSKFISWIPSFGEWGLAIASSIPLTILSLIDQENEGIEGLKYVVIGCISLVTLVSNKFFLSLTHGQIKKVWRWLTPQKKNNKSNTELYFLERVKNGFIESTARANEKIKHLSKKDLSEKIRVLRNIAHPESNFESTILDERWKILANNMFKDLSFSPPRVNKKAVILVPSLAVFTALSWLGLIATVPDGIEEKLSSSKAIQYTLMVIAGIPLFEIGLSVGGSFGLRLSKIGNKSQSLSETITHWIERYIGYVPITLAGLGSFATTATLTIQQFKSVPALCWFLLPSSTLGLDLINISTGCDLWDAILVEAKRKFNPNKALFISHVDFLQDFQKKLKITPEKEIAHFILSLDSNIQENIMRLTQGSEGNDDFHEWRRTLIRLLNE